MCLLNIMIILFPGDQDGRPGPAGEKDVSDLGWWGGLRRPQEATRGLTRFTNAMKPLLWQGKQSKTPHLEKGKPNQTLKSSSIYKAFPSETVLDHLLFLSPNLYSSDRWPTNQRLSVICKKVKPDSSQAGENWSEMLGGGSTHLA